MRYLYGIKPIDLDVNSLEIPKISDEELKNRYSRIKPLVEIDEVTYDLRPFTFSELSGITYTWNKDKDKRNIVHKENLEKIEDFICLHTYGYYGLFKPSIEEILAQLPEKSLKEADYFEIIEKPETREDVFRYTSEYHVSLVRTYKLK